MDAEAYRRAGHEMVDFIADYYSSIREREPLPRVEPGYLRPLLPEGPPAEGVPMEETMKEFNRLIMPGVTHWQHPSFHAFFPAVSSFPAQLGDMLSSALGVIGFSWIGSPACTELEAVVMDWWAKMLHLPSCFTAAEGGLGIIQGTASESVLVAVLGAKARERQKNDVAADPRKLVAYITSQTHVSVRKAAQLADILVHEVAVDDALAMDVADLEAIIATHRADGLVPAFVCGTIGTTSSCAVDPIDAIGTVCNREDIWFHVDAAYAGMLLVCDEFTHMARGVEKAQSFNVNAHKLGMVTFDASMFYSTEKKALADALSMKAAYLRNKATDAGEVIDYKDYQVPLGRRFRSLKVWFVLRTYGTEGIAAVVRRHVRLAQEFEELVRADDRFEIVVPRTMTLVCFRLKSSDDDSKALVERINAAHKIFLLTTVFQDTLVIRWVPVSEQTTSEDVIFAWRAIQEAVESEG